MKTGSLAAAIERVLSGFPKRAYLPIGEAGQRMLDEFLWREQHLKRTKE